VARANHARIRVSPPEMPLHACIHASDEVIVTVSTVGVEASLAGKSVTQVRGSILDHLSPYVAMGVADRELMVAELSPTYRHAAPPWSQGPKHTGPVAPGSNATERVVQVLQSVSERRRAS
jgi:hypothetical protein